MGISRIDFDYLRQLVYDHSGVALDTDKEYLAELHLAPLTKLAGLDAIASLVERLRTQSFGDLHLQAIEALVTNETSFFRDVHPFEALKNFVLPELIEQRKIERRRAEARRQTSLNIWSAACSNGQEPYSIAMLIREYFPTLASRNLRIIASDFSGKALARARQARYNHLEIKRGLSEPLRGCLKSWQLSKKSSQGISCRYVDTAPLRA